MYVYRQLHDETFICMSFTSTFRYKITMRVKWNTIRATHCCNFSHSQFAYLFSLAKCSWLRLSVCFNNDTPSEAVSTNVCMFWLKMIENALYYFVFSLHFLFDEICT